MKNILLRHKFKAGFFSLLLLSIPLLSLTLKKDKGAPGAIKNIVIVHGAFADASGWKGVYDILTKNGYHVTLVQNPLSSLKNDVDATQRILDKQDGPTVLVGHSWGGTVITQAGSHPKVSALVYVAAFQPDKGESTLTWVKYLPASPENGILPADKAGFVYYDKAKFHAGFAADLPIAEADFMYASQGPILGAAFGAVVTSAAWHQKPTYGIVASDDKSIRPETERKMYQRSKTIVTEIKGSHVIFISHPDAVAAVIMQAAKRP